MRAHKNLCLRLLSVLLTLCLMVGMLPAASLAVEDDEGSGNSYTIAVPDTTSAIYKVIAEEFSASGYTATLASGGSGDIVVSLTSDEATYGNEGYAIAVSDDGVVTVTAYAEAGAAYGLRDVLKQMKANNGTVTTVAPTKPYMDTRALFVDCGRKYFSVEWFESIIQEMAWNGMNTLYVSFSNDEGFRLLLNDMSLSFDDGSGNTVTYSNAFMSNLVANPHNLSDSQFLTERNAGAENVCQGLSSWDSSDYLTQEEMARIVAYAKAYGVSIIPELNSPGHMGQILWYFPEYRNVGTWGIDNGPSYALNLEKKEAVNFATALIEKYVDFFAGLGCTDFCIGGDEFAANGSSTATIAAYLNNLASYVKNKGMTAYAWNDGQAVNNGLSTDVVINEWGSNGQTEIASGYKVVNFNSDALYYVLKSYDWTPKPENLFSTWTPLTFRTGTVTDSTNVLGASLAIWCDDANRKTATEVFNDILPDIQAFGYRMWNYGSETAETDYTAFSKSVTTAPAVAENAVLSAANYAASTDTNPDAGSIGVGSGLPSPMQGAGYELVTFASPTVSTNASSGWYYDGGNVIDGDTSTYAWTYGAQNVDTYIRVDLGQLQSLTSVTVTSPKNGDTCTNANVQVSADGVNWVTIGTHSGSSSNAVTDTYSINDGEYRYIQVVITEAKNNWWQLSEISWAPRTEATVADGTYIIVNGTNQAMNTTANSSPKGLQKSTVTISDNIATPVNSAYEWTFTRQDDGTYYITAADGRYLNISGSGVSLSSTAQNITLTISGGKVQLSNGNNAINYYASSDLIFSRWNYDLGDSNNMQTLYKKIDDASQLSTVSLYNAIIAARQYSNDDGRYGAEEYEALKEALTNATAVYTAASAEGTTTTQDKVDTAEQALRAAISALVLTDTTSNYIEIPVEILDFRADGVLFEYDQNAANLGAYDLLKPWASAYADLLPGTAASQEGYADTDVWRRQGLTEPTLVDGNLVYTQATLEYVAALINAGYYSDLTGTADSVGNGYHSTVINWNTAISEKVTAVSGTPGSWADTIAKTSTGANGGYLAWNDVTTSTDLAYYLLTNLYRSTQSDGSTQYNTPVSEVSKLRMLYDEDTGLYTVDAAYQMETSGGYIYNTDLSTGTSNSPGNFDPINGLGYEGSDYGYDDTTDAVDGENFHFTMHAYGSFVYYADQDLYFEFAGDDDVYFFINGQLAMDIGGAHGSCADKLYLNDVADELGLVDGGIYTFDMFYAERHTTASNLRFATNIQIMDTEAVTTKGQYNAKTGESIGYGAIVDAGTTVAYSFNILNLRSVPIKNISFIDDTLGSSLSGSSITLYDPNKTNGATTNIGEIIVYYHTYDRPSNTQDGTLNSSTPVEKTVDEITAMINKANGGTEATSLPSGSYKVSITTEDELKELLALGVPVDTQLCVYGVKRTVVEKDTPYINTVSSRAYYTSNGKNIALNGRASQKLTVMNSFASVEKEQIVIDYGKAININIANITDNLKVSESTTVDLSFYGLTKSGAHTNIRTNTSGIRTELNTIFTPAAASGTYQLLDNGNDGVADVIQFQPTKMLSEVEKVYAVYKVQDSALSDTEYETYYILVEIDIIPATIMYYETDFANSVFTLNDGTTNKWSTEGTAQTEVQDGGTIGVNQTYGFDSTYADDAVYSNGTSPMVEGEKEDNVITTTASFSFIGTGFDLISRTGANQGMIQVKIYAGGETEPTKKVSVLNKSESNLELYQIPVVSVNDLPYGTYDVTIEVYQAVTYTGSLESLSRGGEFYFDALRVYDPIDVSGTTLTGDAAIAQSAYTVDGEANNEIIEVRQLIVDKQTYDDESGMVQNSVVFVDRTADGIAVKDYTTIGPNNEVYLSKDQGIAFKLTSTEIPASIDIGAKSADGNAVTLSAALYDSNKNLLNSISQGISSCTSLFYDLMGNASISGDIYVVITNSSTDESTGILSITDLKVAYAESPKAAAVTLSVDADTPTVAATAFSLLQIEEPEEPVVPEEPEVPEEPSKPNYDILSASFNSKTVYSNQKAIMTVVTTEDVKSLVVTDQKGKKVKTQISSSTQDGETTWTVTIQVSGTGNQTYTVTGYGKDRTAGASASATVTVTSQSVGKKNGSEGRNGK